MSADGDGSAGGARARQQARRRASLGAEARRMWARLRQVLTTEPGTAPDAGAVAGARSRADSAGALKGGVAKVAQLAAYAAPGGDEARTALADLWDAALPVDADAIAAVVAAELGAPPEQVFRRWQRAPLAAASLGQVHAAESADGRPLAVKVQYPQVAEALRADLEAAGVVRELAGLSERLDDAALARLREAVVGELDYRREGAAMVRFARAFADDPAIVVPAYHASLSSARVLTMDRMRGASLATVARAGDPRAGEIGAILFRFAYAAPVVHGILNADPNPGNYLVPDVAPTRVAFLDYGCVVELPAEIASAERALWRGMLHRDPFEGAQQFRNALHDLGLMGWESLAHRDLLAWEAALAEPFRHERFRWDRAYAERLDRATRAVLSSGRLRLPAPIFLLWRARLGVAAVLGYLDAEAPYRAILRELLAQ